MSALPEGLTRELLHERVSLLRPHVVLYREVAGTSRETIAIMPGRVHEPTEDLERFDLVVDLTVLPSLEDVERKLDGAPH